MKLKVLLSSVVLVVFTGCAYIRSETKDPVYGIAVSGGFTNVSFVGYKKTVVRAYTIFDSKSDLSKFSNSTGGMYGTNGFSVPAGTRIGGLSLESQTTTNFNDLIGNIVQSAVKGAAQGIK